MKKASRILYIVSTAVGFSLMGTFLLVAIIFGFYCTPFAREIIIEGINNGSITSDFQGTPEEVATYIQTMFLYMAAAFGGAGIACGITGIIGAIGIKAKSKAFAIISIIAGGLCDSATLLIAGIFALITLSQEEKAKQIQ